MRLLITGATGLIGSHITKLCKEKNIQVNYLTTSKDKIEKDPGYQGFYWNPDKEELDEKCFEDVDAIIHLAGASIDKRWTSEYKKLIVSSRVDTARLIYKKLKHSSVNIPAFISASAVGIYPSSLQNLYFEEERATDDSFLGNVVVRWEAAANEFRELGMDVAKVRIGIVMARDGGALPKLKKPVKYAVGAPLGGGKQWQSWIHIEDLARIFLFVTEQRLEGVYNAVAPAPVTNEEMTRAIAGKLDKPLWLPNVPGFVLKLAMGEMAVIVLSSQLVSSSKIENAGFEFRYKNFGKTIDNLLE